MLRVLVVRFHPGNCDQKSVKSVTKSISTNYGQVCSLAYLLAIIGVGSSALIESFLRFARIKYCQSLLVWPKGKFCIWRNLLSTFPPCYGWHGSRVQTNNNSYVSAAHFYNNCKSQIYSLLHVTLNLIFFNALLSSPFKGGQRPSSGILNNMEVTTDAP